MTTIEEITHAERLPGDVIADIKNKTISIIPWAQLEKQYEQSKHPVMDKMIYPDKVVKGKVEKVTRITLGLQKLAVKRMTGLMFGIPVQRVWKPREGNSQEKKAAEILEAMFMKNRIDSMNRERSKYLFAGCEFVTIWYTQEQEAEYAGEPTDVKIRSVSFSPMNGDQLYPLFDEFGDLVALSVEYSRTENSLTVSYFETYTATEHIRWRTEGNNITEEKREKIDFGKIPGIYIYRPTPYGRMKAETSRKPNGRSAGAAITSVRMHVPTGWSTPTKRSNTAKSLPTTMRVAMCCNMDKTIKQAMSPGNRP